MLGGYANRIAWIDLTSGEIEYKPVDEGLARTYIGGRGMGVRFVLDNGPHVDPLSPENILCLMTGPITGTLVNMSGRMAVVTRSPLTGTVTDSHHGGWSGARLKWAGFDGLVFRGRADHPVYAYVEEGRVELLDASPYWGKGVHETVAALKERHGSEDLSVLAIGPAGENRVRFACMVNEDQRAAGRGGTGAVAGSKNLKAVVVKAPKRPPKPADPEAFLAARSEALAKIAGSPITSPRKGGLSVYGTNVLMNMTNVAGALPVRNGQTTTMPTAELTSGEWVREHILAGDPTCYGCPVACKKEVEIKEGPFKVRGQSFEYESAWALGVNCGNDDAESIAYMLALCNDLGMDTLETGNALSMSMEASERGLLRGEMALAWGDAEAMVRTIEAVARRREGLGELLADGPARAAERLGAPELSMSVKGQSIPAYDPRGIQGMALGYATSNRGACHLRGYTPAAELLGIPVESDRLAWRGKAELLKTFQDLHAFSDSMDVCKFSAFAESAENYAAQFSAVTGWKITAEDVMRIGERIYNLERYYNNLAGFTGRDDTLPRRFLEEPAAGGSEGSVAHLDEMLAEYYALRGWQDGVVPESKLQELGIEPVQSGAA
ncbi:MAG: aldehyde ferredoxin oxidoreductase family protein [Bacillota bacterium]|nr:aldehyde ferredoxin oxidoreductase family protein [Bacillota bacterium]